MHGGIFGLEEFLAGSSKFCSFPFSSKILKFQVREADNFFVFVLLFCFCFYFFKAIEDNLCSRRSDNHVFHDCKKFAKLKTRE